MTSFLTTYKDKLILLVFGILATLLVIGYFYIDNQSSQIEKLTAKNNELTLKLSVEKANNVTLSSEILSQNKEIEANKTDYESNLKAYEEWQSKPAEIRYKTIVKEIKSDDCADIKTALDELSTLEF